MNRTPMLFLAAAFAASFALPAMAGTAPLTAKTTPEGHTAQESEPTTVRRLVGFRLASVFDGHHALPEPRQT